MTTSGKQVLNPIIPINDIPKRVSPASIFKCNADLIEAKVIYYIGLKISLRRRIKAIYRKNLSFNNQIREMNKLFTLMAAICIASITVAQNCSSEDLQYLNDNGQLVSDASIACGTQCVFSPDQETCFTECMQAQVEITNLCLECFSQKVSCTLENCLVPCAFGETEDCAACVSNFCLVSFNYCAGIVDIDEDGFDTLSDCDDGNELINPDATEIWYDGIDQNCDGLNDFDQDQDGDAAFGFGGTDCDDLDPNVQGGQSTYFEDNDGDGFGNLFSSQQACNQPEGYVQNNEDCDDTRDDVYIDAPGTGEGIDNNCDGGIDGDEMNECMGDLDNDLTINATDLLLFLADFGCQGMCIADFNSSGSTGADDLLFFLSAYGQNCQ